MPHNSSEHSRMSENTSEHSGSFHSHYNQWERLWMAQKTSKHHNVQHNLQKLSEPLRSNVYTSENFKTSLKNVSKCLRSFKNRSETAQTTSKNDLEMMQNIPELEVTPQNFLECCRTLKNQQYRLWIPQNPWEHLRIQPKPVKTSQISENASKRSERNSQPSETKENTLERLRPHKNARRHLKTFSNLSELFWTQEIASEHLRKQQSTPRKTKNPSDFSGTF